MGNEKEFEFKDTQGPWIGEIPKEDHIFQMHDITAFDILAGTDFIISCQFKSGRTLQQLQADALLISKAPELLEMLKESLLQLEYLSNKFGETGSGNNVISRIETLLTQATTLP